MPSFLLSGHYRHHSSIGTEIYHSEAKTCTWENVLPLSSWTLATALSLSSGSNSLSADFIVSFLLLLLNRILLCIYTRFKKIIHSAEGHLGWFYFSAMVNMDMRVCPSPGMVKPSNMEAPFLVVWELSIHTDFQSSCPSVRSYQQWLRVLLCPQSQQQLFSFYFVLLFLWIILLSICH